MNNSISAESPDAGIAGSVRTNRNLLIPLALTLLYAAMLWPYRHFSGDDAYITFRFVRNLSNGLGYAFNPGEPTYGSTAPLWVLILTGVHKLGLSIENAAHALNGVFSLSSVPLMWFLSGRFVKQTIFRTLAVVFLMLDPWAIRWNMSGMENSFALCLLLATLLTWEHYRNSGKVDWATPTLLALATLTRPEMALLTLIVGGDILLRERRRLVGNLVALCVVYSLVLTPWLVYAHASFGTIVPNTITAKVSKNHLAAFTGTLKYFASFWPFQAAAVLCLPLILRRVDLKSIVSDNERSHWILPLAWGLALPVFYIVGGAPVSGRYLMYAMPCYLLVGMKAWSVIWERYRAAVILAATCTLLLVVFVQYKYCWFITRWPLGMDPRMIELARVARAHATPGAIVACDQIGVMGYFSDLYVLDTIGLVSPEVLTHRNSKDSSAMWRYVHERGADFLFVTEDLPRLRSRGPVYGSLQLISHDLVTREGARAVDGDIEYFLYKTNWQHPVHSESSSTQ